MGILDDYFDDLLYDIFFEEPENDIMEVVRGWFDSPVSFLDPYDGQLVFKREDELGFIEKEDIIPELNLTQYSRCIALRMDENGEFGSLQEGDGEFIEKYLAR